MSITRPGDPNESAMSRRSASASSSLPIRHRARKEVWPGKKIADSDESHTHPSCLEPARVGALRRTAEVDAECQLVTTSGLENDQTARASCSFRMEPGIWIHKRMQLPFLYRSISKNAYKDAEKVLVLLLSSRKTISLLLHNIIRSDFHQHILWNFQTHTHTLSLSRIRLAQPLIR